MNPCELDQFYAAVPGQAAWERRPDDPSAPPYGIYTRCLLAALSGIDSRAVTQIVDGPTPQAVLSKGLRDYLVEVVPAEAWQQTGNPQWPDSVAGSFWKPNVLAWVHPKKLSDQEPGAAPSDGSSDGFRISGPSGDGPDSPGSGDSARPFPLPHNPDINTAIAREEEVCRQAGRTVGVFVTGTDVVGAVGGAVWEYRRGGWGGSTRPISETRPLEVYSDSGGWRVLDWRNGPSPTLFYLEAGGDQRVISATTTFSGYTTVLRASQRGVEQAFYVPTKRADRNIEENISMLARASVLWRMNLFDPDAEEWRRLLFDDLNPGLAVQAAYAWERQGNQDRITELADRFRIARRLLPLDLAFLARGRTRQAGCTSVFPLMTCGWPAFIGPEPG